MLRGEVWWVEFDPAIGNEIGRIRLGVVSNNSVNRNLGRVIVVPLTSNTEQIYPDEARVSLLVKKAKHWPTRS